MLLDLRPHDIGQDLAAAVRRALDHGRGGLVAGGFYAQYQHWRIGIQSAPFSPLALIRKAEFWYVR
ncbi:hypothetical protein [Bradyrhizobium sp. LM2.3]